MSVLGSYTVSRKLLVVISAVYLLDYLMDGRLSNLLMLVPSAVIENMDFWRLFTFPLAPGHLEGVFLFAFAMYFIAPRLEEHLGNSLIIALLAPLAFIQGILYTLLFWNGQVSISGAEGISFFIMTLFALFNPMMKIRLWFLPRLKIVIMTLLIIFSWTVIKFFHALTVGEEILFYSMYPAIFGIVAGLSSYLQIYLMRKLLLRKEKVEIPNPPPPEPEELKMAMIASARQQKLEAIREKESPYKLGEDPELNQQLLDEILDKIIENGRDSLTPDEENFLRDYSKHA